LALAGSKPLAILFIRALLEVQPLGKWSVNERPVNNFRLP